MARVTTEDCLKNNDINRFDLVIIATKRARNLALYGAKSTIEKSNDKETVLALREIAEYGAEHIKTLCDDQ